MTFGSLFSGVGGMDLGLEQAGMQCVFQVEKDPYCRKVLAKHWPDVPRFDDVVTFNAGYAEQPDLICGGWPCQDISLAGGGNGLDGAQSGLFTELWRIVCEFRPGIVLLENSPAILVRGLDRVLSAMAASGYDAEWDCLPAGAFGAFHNRNRWFCVGWDSRAGHGLRGGTGRALHRGDRLSQRGSGGRGDAGRVHRLLSSRMDSPDSDSAGERLEIRERLYAWRQEADAPTAAFDWWADVPGSLRVADGVPDRVDRVKGIGNAVCVPVARWIGQRIQETSSVLYG